VLCVSRILKAYQTRFRWLLEGVHARQLEGGVEWLVNKARRLSAKEQLSLADALTRVYEDLARRPGFQPVHPPVVPEFFYCDAGLGGLARWLRAAGYDARWQAGIDDNELLEQARHLSAVLLTTDGMLMERRILRDRLIPSFWLPPTLSIGEQLKLVFREFGLQMRSPRCMSCGGPLRMTEKTRLRERIPPRTYRWLDEYFVCARCGKLFWHGTHWLKIRRNLNAIAESTRRGMAQSSS
jgi:uncharacterized protein with PIN domain